MRKDLPLEPLPGHNHRAVPTPDDLLIEQSLLGDHSAFEELVNRYKRRVLAIARHFFRNHETVEDIAQETFSKAFLSLSSYRRGTSLFEQWLARIAVNNCYDELRRRKKRGEMPLADLTDDEVTWLDAKLSRVSFEIHFNSGEQEKAAEIAEKLLSKLSVEDRLILTLLHSEERSIREIAQLLGWSEAKVKIRAFRARIAARRILNRVACAERRKARTSREIQPSSARSIELRRPL